MSWPQYSPDLCPYFLIEDLYLRDGLDKIELDSSYAEITPRHKQGLSEDEVDDLIHDYAYQTTPIGTMVIKSLDPRKRFKEFTVEFPELTKTAYEVLEFLKEKRSMGSIDNLLRDTAALKNNGIDGRPLQSSVLVDKLERSGCIYWNDGWIISKGGKRVMEERTNS
jgi:hypothetical protein